METFINKRFERYPPKYSR